jgi:DNA-binding response OmpR family regulator
MRGVSVHGRSILVVEDDAQLGSLYRTALGIAGFSVRLATDGLQALREIDADPPHLIVLDLSLPYVDGLAVRQELAAQAHTRDIPVVVVTGSPLDLSHLDVPCVMRKPVNPDDLVRAVHKCLLDGSANLI